MPLAKYNDYCKGMALLSEKTEFTETESNPILKKFHAGVMAGKYRSVPDFQLENKDNPYTLSYISKNRKSFDDILKLFV